MELTRCRALAGAAGIVTAPLLPAIFANAATPVNRITRLPPDWSGPLGPDRIELSN